MKRPGNVNWMKTVFDLCLVFSSVFTLKRVSLFIFGEPEYPTED